jgi:hypothetical protein
VEEEEVEFIYGIGKSILGKPRPLWLENITIDLAEIN